MTNDTTFAIDPICGMQVNPQTAISADKDGKKFYFCCPKCRERFLSGESPSSPKLVTLGLPASRVAGTPHSPLPALPTSQPIHSCCAGHGTSEPVIPAADKAYFCPMCPGEESDTPGYCSKCGMALERNPNFHDPQADTASLRAEKQLRNKVLAAGILATCVFLLAMLPMVGFSFGSVITAASSAWLQLLLTLPILLLAWPYWQAGFGAVRRGSANMFTLIGLGAWSAFLLSLIGMLVPSWLPRSFHGDHHSVPLYFESAAVIVAFVLLGQWLEGSARKRTGSDLEKLVKLLPKMAHRIKEGSIEDVEPLQLQKDDVIIVKPGESVPADSLILEGIAELDESLLTGESLPVTKQIGDKLMAGTINHASVIKARVQASGDRSLLSQIIRSVGNAQRSRAPIQDTVDRVTAYFVPAVIGIAAMAAIAWSLFGPEPKGAYAFLAALSVLVIACPCALGLATPMSIIVGVGRAAREGYLIRDAKVFQQLADVDTIVLDKTGTITEGKPVVVAWHPISHSASQSDIASALRSAAGLEQTSEHPLAQAIVRYALQQKAISLTEPAPTSQQIEVKAGYGTTGLVNQHRVAIGKPAWVKSLLKITLEDTASLAENRPVGSSRIWLAIDDELVAIIDIADQPRASAISTVEALKAEGINVELLSGDSAAAVQHIAQSVGISTFRSEVSPEDKRRHIEQLKNKQHRVAMIGDGINDAPALAAANVGIALASGTDLANETSDITLLEGDLRRLLAAIRLSRQVVRNIRQNLLLGLIYNVVAIPIAAGALYPWTGWLLSPMIAAAAMAASSLSVVGNALRLRLQR